MSRPTTTQKWTIASFALNDAYTDFILSRQAIPCTPATLTWYQTLLGAFLTWIESQSIKHPEEITARYVRQYLAMLAHRELQDTTLHANARVIRTLLKFWHEEGYTAARVKFDMPKLKKKRLPSLTAEQLQIVLKACNVRDRAMVCFMADSGLRRAEVCKLNWGDVDMTSGRVRIIQGKGNKDRSSAVGAFTRRMLLKYRRTIENRADPDPLFQTKQGTRLGKWGQSSLYRRLRKRTGIHVTPHAMRRTFTILSLRADMDALYVKNLGGWESWEMLERYAQMEDIDLLRAHKEHSPIDNLDRLK